ncbi:hypothetical protein HTG_13020 [Natrinema mahii]|nr:hypothetical protein HTG_13020 [Natrinema mahii]
MYKIHNKTVFTPTRLIHDRLSVPDGLTPNRPDDTRSDPTRFATAVARRTPTAFAAEEQYRSIWKAARVLRPTVGGGEARTLGCVPVFKYWDALPRFGTHVIGLAKPAHPLRGKTRCRAKDEVFRDHENLRFSNDTGPVSRPREGADAHGHTRHGSNRRPLLRWHSRCVRVLPVPRKSLQRRARAELNSPPVVSLAPRQRPRRSHGPPCPWYFTYAGFVSPSVGTHDLDQYFCVHNG